MHMHFIVWAAEAKRGTDFVGVTYIDITAKTMDEAVERAKELCPGRAHYWVNNIIEHEDHVSAHSG